jgi:superfamily II DNA or RNA helicase
LEWVEPYEDAGEPVVVFSAHRAPIDALGAREGWATITGDTPAAKRTEIVARFQAGELKGVACTIMAAGTGLTLTRACTCLFVDLDWTPALNVQAQDRLHRIGQTAQSVLYVRMVSDHPLDLHIQALIAKKMEMIAGAIERLVKVAPVEAAASTGQTEASRLEREAAAIREVETREAREKCRSITARQREKLGGEAPELELTPARVQTIRDALDAMLEVCDGAHVKDGLGFNKPDAVRSRWLNVLGLDDEDAQRCALSMLQGYRRQLGERFPCLWKERK